MESAIYKHAIFFIENVYANIYVFTPIERLSPCHGKGGGLSALMIPWAVWFES